jgi:predicted Zn-dependent peptidase
MTLWRKIKILFMIDFERFTLDNGLRVIVHRDTSTPIVAMNIVYNVGARDEDPDLTGFAHLFEHLMFGGSKHIPRYDEVLEKVGGDNNAFTNNDITNYYLTVPKENLETAFWLESDRMYDLAFSPKSLEVQRNVVIEEYKQRYLNQPYGDVWLLLRPLVYKVHPYRWATIGKDISHIENAKMEDVKAFYKKFYNPSNAVMVIAGDVETGEIKRLSGKWFGPIDGGRPYERNLPQEPPQTQSRFLEVEREVPVNALFKVYHMCDRLHKDYYATDLISDILSNGKSSRMNIELHKNQKLFSSVSAFISGDMDAGMFVVAGYLNEGVGFEEAAAGIERELKKLIEDGVGEKELEKVKNKVESAITVSEVNVLDKAMNLAYFELLGDAAMANEEVAKYRMVTADDIKRVAAGIFTENNVSTMFYKKI